MQCCERETSILRVTQAGDFAAQAGHRPPSFFCAGVSRPANQQDSPTLRCSLTTAAATA